MHRTGRVNIACLQSAIALPHFWPIFYFLSHKYTRNQVFYGFLEYTMGTLARNTAQKNEVFH